VSLTAVVLIPLSGLIHVSADMMMIDRYVVFTLIPVWFILGISGFWLLKREIALKTKKLTAQMDITRQNEEQLRQERNFLDRIMETSPTGIVRVDVSGKLVYANKRAEEILGMHFSEDLSKTYDDPAWEITDFYGQAFPVEALPFNIVRENHSPVYDVQHAIRWPDGRRVFLSINASPLFDESDTFDGMVAVIDDITEKYKAEQDYKMLFREMLEGFALHEILCDDSGKPVNYRFLAVNPAFERITGLKAEFLVGKSVLDVLPQTESYWIETYGKVALTGEPAAFVNYSRELNRHFQVTAFRYVENQFACIFNDITSQVEFEKRMSQAQKMESIGTLAGGIAHDFNNILFPVIGHTEMLLEDIPKDSPLRDSLNEIYGSTLRARDLVAQILAFSRQGKSELKLMKMQPIIKEVLKLIRATIPATISIHQDLQSDCGLVEADPTRIHQIIMNLATNAYHAMQENGGKLDVVLKQIQLNKSELTGPDMVPGLYACLIISDTGTGMDKQTMDKIFDPFFTTKEKGKGTGMGLSVVHGIVKSMNGAVKVCSEPGKGTEFHVFLPIVQSMCDMPEKHEKMILQGGTETLMLIDDEKSIVTVETNALERLGYQVISFENSMDALTAFRYAPDQFDMVISDIAMPHMPGDKLAAELIRIRPDIPILLCTGFSENISEEKTASIGVRGFLLKPIIIKDLAKKIRQILDDPSGRIYPPKKGLN